MLQSRRLSKITPENRDQFTRLFVDQLLTNHQLLDRLIDVADFRANFHHVWAGGESGCDGCSHCYSGDTDFEVNAETQEMLAQVWKSAFLKLPISDDSDGEEE